VGGLGERTETAMREDEKVKAAMDEKDEVAGERRVNQSINQWSKFL